MQKKSYHGTIIGVLGNKLTTLGNDPKHRRNGRPQKILRHIVSMFIITDGGLGKGGKGLRDGGGGRAHLTLLQSRGRESTVRETGAERGPNCWRQRIESFCGAGWCLPLEE